MEAVYTAEMLVPTYQSAGLYKPEEPIRIWPLLLRVSFVVCSTVYSRNLDIKVIEREDVGWGGRDWWLELFNGFWFFRHHKRRGIYWIIEGPLTSRKELGCVELPSTLLCWLFLYSVLSLQSYRIQNRVARKILGPERDEVTENWRRLHSKELHKLYISPNIMRVEHRTEWPGR